MTQHPSNQRPVVKQPPIPFYSSNQKTLWQNNQWTGPFIRTLKLRSTLLLVVIAGLALMLSACGQRATGGNTIELAQEYSAAVDLPAIVIDYDTEGTPSVGGMPLADFLDLFGLNEVNTGLFHLDPALITHLTESNIQHVQLDNSTNGLVLLVNGEPIPSLVWDDDSLMAVAEVMELAGFGIESLDTVLPLIQTVGVGTIVRFPIKEGLELIPTVVTGEGSVAESMTATQTAFQESVGDAAQIQVIVTYAEDGSWSVAGMDATQWSQIIPLPWEDLNLAPAVVAQLRSNDVNAVGFASNSDGFFVSVNDKTLPYLAWGNGELQHLLNLLANPELADYLIGGGGESLAQILPLVRQWLPVLQMANVRLTVNFP